MSEVVERVARFTPWRALSYGGLGWAVVRHEFENSSWGRWYYPRNGAPQMFGTEAEAEAIADKLNAALSEGTEQ